MSPVQEKFELIMRQIGEFLSPERLDAAVHRAVTQTGAPGTAGRGEAAKAIILILLAAGADPSLTNKSGRKPADYVTDETMESLLKKRGR